MQEKRVDFDFLFKEAEILVSELEKSSTSMNTAAVDCKYGVQDGVYRDKEIKNNLSCPEIRQCESAFSLEKVNQEFKSPNQVLVDEIEKLSTRNVWQKRWVILDNDSITVFHGKKYDLKRYEMSDMKFPDYCIKVNYRLQFDEVRLNLNDFHKNAKEKNYFYFSFSRGGLKKYFKCEKNTMLYLKLNKLL